jgi:hypothetical protein
MRFTSGSWTLNMDAKFGTSPSRRQEIFTNFSPNCISNNHVLPANDRISALIMNAGKGDQIWMKGYLVDYTTPKWEGSWRESSTVRDDRGCEVVYVTDFKIQRKADQGWRTAYEMSKLLMLSSLVLYIIAFSIEAFMTGR